MPLHVKPTARKLAIAFILLLSLAASPAAAEPEYTPQSLDMTVYGDGSVKVAYGVEVDPTKVRVDVELFGEGFINLIVRDEDGNPLAWDADGSLVTVDSIGAVELSFTYLTSSFTFKEGVLWSVNVTVPVSTSFRLPKGAAIFYISDIPEQVGTKDGAQFVVMPLGNVSLSYIIGMESAEEAAQEAITEADAYISAKIGEGLLLDDAVLKLKEAQQRYTDGEYATAEVKAMDALAAAEATVTQAENAYTKLQAASRAIDDAKAEGRVEGIQDVEDKQATAQGYYNEGMYTEAESLAEQAKEQANRLEKPSGGYTLIIAGAGILAVAGGAFLMLSKRKTTAPEKPTEEPKGVIDVEALFSDNPDLRMEDREVIKFIVGNGGEAFASEIRDRFDLPRSSAWRLIRRLVGLEIAVEEKVGNQSLVKISDEYRRVK